MSYYTSKIIAGDFEDVVERVTLALKEEGFGVLTEIRVDEVFKKKLDIDFKKYRILGACNPNFAHKAILEEDKIGVMLPCNVLVEQHVDGGVEVTAVNPIASMQAVQNKSLTGIAEEVSQKLERVIESL